LSVSPLVASQADKARISIAILPHVYTVPFGSPPTIAPYPIRTFSSSESATVWPS